MMLGAIELVMYGCIFFFSSRRRHTRSDRDWSSDVCSSDLKKADCNRCHKAVTLNYTVWSPKTRKRHIFGDNAEKKEKCEGEDSFPPFLLSEIGRASCRERV